MKLSVKIKFNKTTIKKQRNLKKKGNHSKAFYQLIKLNINLIKCRALIAEYYIGSSILYDI